jgi:hypothetical protein
MLNSRDVSDRRILAADRELRSLEKNRCTIRDLETPYQRGWRRDYVLTERSRDREDREVLEDILKIIGSTIVRPDRSFKGRQRRTGALCEISQPLRPISNNEWIYKKYPTRWIRYFRYELRLERNNHWQPYWIFILPSLYRLKISRNMIHQVRDIDPDIERRIGELERWFEISQAWARLSWLKGRRQSWHWRGSDDPKQKLTNKRHRQEIARACEIFPEVDPAASVWRIPTSLRPTFLSSPGVAQCRGNELRPRPVQVRVLPPGPFPSAPVAQRRGSGLKPRPVPVQVRPGASPDGTRSGQARRDSLLRKSSRTAGWGACPPRSAIFHQITSWNANRTSVPGFLGKEIVPHHAGWGASTPRSAIFIRVA